MTARVQFPKMWDDETRSPGRHHWRRWRFSRWLMMQAYCVGISSGGCSTQRGSDPNGYYDRTGRWRGSFVDTVDWLGKPVYLLWWPVWKWRCVLVERHWPGEPLGMERCGKCIPCPYCGSTGPLEHPCPARR